MSVTGPQGFLAAGTASGIKESGALDLALLVAAAPTGEGGGGKARPVPTAGVFTTSRAPAAPVLLCRRHLAATGGRASAVVVNSGCANAATGEPGAKVAARTAELAAAHLGVPPEEVLVCSTGIIGQDLPFAPIEEAMPNLVSRLERSREAETAAATAIMTTDTRPKQTLVSRAGFSVGGMCKGAGMIAPNMATMLAFLTTDAAVDPKMLQAALAAAVEPTFNRISIDGCTSTNDTVLVMASGGAADPVSPGELTEALTEACADLAYQIMADAEGGTKVAKVTVTGARSEEDAVRAARAIADSALVKCSLFGADPNWGRILGAAAVSGAAFDPAAVSVGYGPIRVCEAGRATGHDEAAVRAHLEQHDVEISCDLGAGTATASVLGCDLTYGYIDENTGRS